MEPLNWCLYCGQHKVRIQRHLVRKHADKPDVKKLIIMNSGPEKRSLMAYLRNEGNSLHNFDVKKRGSGVIRVARAPSNRGEIPDARQYISCHLCKALYLRKQLHKHSCRRATEAEKPSLQASRLLAAKSENELEGMAIVLSELHEDEIGNIVRTEPLLIELLKFRTANGLWKMKKVRDTLRGDLRYGARLVKHFKETVPEYKTLVDFFKPDNFMIFVASALAVGLKKDTGKQGEAALKIGNVVKSLAERLACHGGIAPSEEVRVDAEKFLLRYGSDWTVLVSKPTRSDMGDFRRNKIKAMPSREDVMKLATGLSAELEEAINTHKAKRSLTSMRRLQEVTMCKVATFNRKRGQDVSTMLVEDFKRAMTSDISQNDEFTLTLNDEQKENARRYKLVTVVGKNNKDNFCLLNEQVVEALNLIIEDRVTVGQMLPENQFVFGLPGTRDSFIRHYKAMKSFSEKFGVTNVNTRAMRIYFCTNAQLIAKLSGTPVTVEGLARHMGHHPLTQVDHYRLQPAVYELGVMSGLLEKADQGNLHVDVAGNEELETLQREYVEYYDSLKDANDASGLELGGDGDQNEQIPDTREDRDEDTRDPVADVPPESSDAIDPSVTYEEYRNNNILEKQRKYLQIFGRPLEATKQTRMARKSKVKPVEVGGPKRGKIL